MEDWEKRWQTTTKAHRDISECAARIDDLIDRLDGACMTGLADLISDVPALLRGASGTISGDASEDINERIASSEKQAGNILQALLDRPN